MAQAGFTPLQVLQMTTLDGTKLLGKDAHAGSVEEGKDANLVMLDANPMESVQNLHGIYAVVRGGNFYSKQALEGLKDKVQQHVESTKLPAERATP